MDAMPDAGSMEPQLRLDQTLSNTNYFSVPVSGKGPASGSLLVETPARGAYSTTIAPDGCFCLDVPLTPEMTNTLKFKAMDTMARYTPEVKVDVAQSGTPPGMPTPGQPTSLARNSTVQATTLTLQSGTWSMVTDGSASTWVDAENSVFSDDWVSFKLGQRGAVDMIRVRSQPDCPMKDYNIFISDAASPGPAVSGGGQPGYFVGDWAYLYHQTNGSGYDGYQLTPATTTSYFGIQFLSTDCYGPVSNHFITEIEVWTPPPAPDSPDAPSCANTPRSCGT